MNSARFTGRPASPGLACGPIVVIETPAAIARHKGDPLMEAAALRDAMRSAAETLAQLAAEAEGGAADIMRFQVALLDDEALSHGAFAAIESGTAAVEAWLLKTAKSRERKFSGTSGNRSMAVMASR